MGLNIYLNQKIISGCDYLDKWYEVLGFWVPHHPIMSQHSAIHGNVDSLLWKTVQGSQGKAQVEFCVRVLELLWEESTGEEDSLARTSFCQEICSLNHGIRPMRHQNFLGRILVYGTCHVSSEKKATACSCVF